MGQGKVGGVTCRLLCTWWLLGLAVKGAWLGPGGPILTLTARTGLETLLIPFRGLVSGKEGCLGSEQECDN